MQIEYRLIRSDRKTIAIQIRPGGEVVVRAPKYMSNARIRGFICNKLPWIKEKLAKTPAVTTLTESERQELLRRGKQMISARVAHFAPLVGVNYGRITIRSQRTRWGSCSGKGNLNFNCLLMLAPPEVLDYIVVHELCHRKVMDHSARFWAEVKRVLPNYEERVKWLKDNGKALIGRLG